MGRILAEDPVDQLVVQQSDRRKADKEVKGQFTNLQQLSVIFVNRVTYLYTQ